MSRHDPSGTNTIKTFFGAIDDLNCSVTRFGVMFGHLLRAKIEFGNILNLSWQIIYAIGQILLAINDQILNI